MGPKPDHCEEGMHAIGKTWSALSQLSRVKRSSMQSNTSENCGSVTLVRKVYVPGQQ